MEDISHANIVPLLYELIKNARETHDSFIGFDRDRGRRRNELTNNRNIQGKFHLGNMLKVYSVLQNTKKTLLMD